MAYGIQVTSSTGTLQFDTDQPYSYLKVISKGTATSLTSIQPYQLVCVRPSTGLSLALALGSNKTGTSPYTYTFYNTGHGSVSLDYIVLEAAKLGTITTTGYGFQLFNVDGQIVIDSGNFVSGTSTGDNAAQITALFGANSVGGDPTLSSSIVYTGADYLSVYACVNASVFWSNGYNYVGFKWNSADTTIRFSSWVSIPPTAYTNNLAAAILVKTV